MSPHLARRSTMPRGGKAMSWQFSVLQAYLRECTSNSLGVRLIRYGVRSQHLPRRQVTEREVLSRTRSRLVNRMLTTLRRKTSLSSLSLHQRTSLRTEGPLPSIMDCPGAILPSQTFSYRQLNRLTPPPRHPEVSSIEPMGSRSTNTSMR